MHRKFNIYKILNNIMVTLDLHFRKGTSIYHVSTEQHQVNQDQMTTLHKVGEKRIEQNAMYVVKLSQLLESRFR